MHCGKSKKLESYSGIQGVCAFENVSVLPLWKMSTSDSLWKLRNVLISMWVINGYNGARGP